MLKKTSTGLNPAIKRTEHGFFVMVNDSHLSRWCEKEGRLDNAHQFLEQFHRFVPEGGTVIDAGTCIGDHTVTYASWVGGNGRVLGFEANPDVAECAALNLTLYPHATIYNVALSNRNGVGGLWLEDNIGASFLTKKVGDRVIHVKHELLDDYIDRVNRCDFMKVDIEGNEPMLIEGGREFISRYKPVILLEINKGSLENQGFMVDSVFVRLTELGYKWKVVSGKSGDPQYEILAQKS